MVFIFAASDGSSGKGRAHRVWCRYGNGVCRGPAASQGDSLTKTYDLGSLSLLIRNGRGGLVEDHSSQVPVDISPIRGTCVWRIRVLSVGSPAVHRIHVTCTRTISIPIAQVNKMRCMAQWRDERSSNPCRSL